MAHSVFCLLGSDGKVSRGQISTFGSDPLPFLGLVPKWSRTWLKKSGPVIPGPQEPLADSVATETG
jgi:hypothetical protein